MLLLRNKRIGMSSSDINIVNSGKISYTCFYVGAFLTRYKYAHKNSRLKVTDKTHGCSMFSLLNFSLILGV